MNGVNWSAKKNIKNYKKNNSMDMMKQDVSEKYKIPMYILELYEDWNLCRKDAGFFQYDDTDLEYLGMIMTLYNAGFKQEEILKYMQLFLKGGVTAAERMCILKKKRDQVLQEIHAQEKRLEDLDYLRFKMRKESLT